MPCGKQAELSTKGYFPTKRNRRGRQMGRVLATATQEVVVDQLYAGTMSLVTALPGLIEAAETILQLGPAKRSRTIIRLDAGGGSLDNVNWLLSRGYEVCGKEFSGKRAQMLARSVTTWVDDPEILGRQV